MKHLKNHHGYVAFFLIFSTWHMEVWNINKQIYTPDIFDGHDFFRDIFDGKWSIIFRVQLFVFRNCVASRFQVEALIHKLSGGMGKIKPSQSSHLSGLQQGWWWLVGLQLVVPCFFCWVLWDDFLVNWMMPRTLKLTPSSSSSSSSSSSWSWSWSSSWNLMKSTCTTWRDNQYGSSQHWSTKMVPFHYFHPVSLVFMTQWAEDQKDLQTLRGPSIRKIVFQGAFFGCEDNWGTHQNGGFLKWWYPTTMGSPT